MSPKKAYKKKKKKKETFQTPLYFFFSFLVLLQSMLCLFLSLISQSHSSMVLKQTELKASSPVEV